MDSIILNILTTILVFFIDPQNNSNILEMKHCYLLSTDSQYREEFLGSQTEDEKYTHKDTKAQLSRLKSALLAFHSDVGRLPYVGNVKEKKSAYNQGLLLNMLDSEKNVLVSNNNKHMDVKNYNKKWRGPYMEGKPSQFMVDSWGTPIKYVAEGKNVYLWSYGPNRKPDCESVEQAFKKQMSNEVDDIVVSVMRFKKSFED